MNALFRKFTLGVAMLAVPAAAAERATIYSPVGKRDPFKPPAVTSGNRGLSAVSPLEKFAVEQLQLRAVLRGLGKARAMFEDPEGRTYIVKEGDLIGRERATISRILNSEVIVTERSFNYLGEETLYEKILSLPAEPEVDTGATQPASGNARGKGADAAPPPMEGPKAGAGGGDGGGLVY